jgi:hypothetical protein
LYLGCAVASDVGLDRPRRGAVQALPQPADRLQPRACRCTKKPRIFDADSHYDFDATETEPPNTNSFFGTGGYSVWAADTTQQKVRGCIIISSGLGSDITKCLDMSFQ